MVKSVPVDLKSLSLDLSHFYRTSESLQQDYYN